MNKPLVARLNPSKLQEMAQNRSGKVEAAGASSSLHLFPGVITPGHSIACPCLLILSNTIVRSPGPCSACPAESFHLLRQRRALKGALHGAGSPPAPSRTFPCCRLSI